MQTQRSATRAILSTIKRPCQAPPPSLSRQSWPRAHNLSTTSRRAAKNQVFDPVRNSNSLHTYLSSSSASNIPLLTLWTASWCPTCRTIAPLIRSLVESGVGEEHGGVNYCPVEFDSPEGDMHGLAANYMITAIPTLMAFDARRSEPVNRLTDARNMADRQFLADWIRTEAQRRDGGGGGRGGGGGGGSAFGGLFGSRK